MLALCFLSFLYLNRTETIFEKGFDETSKTYCCRLKQVLSVFVNALKQIKQIHDILSPNYNFLHLVLRSLLHVLRTAAPNQMLFIFYFYFYFYLFFIIFKFIFLPPIILFIRLLGLALLIPNPARVNNHLSFHSDLCVLIAVQSGESVLQETSQSWQQFWEERSVAGLEGYQAPKSTIQYSIVQQRAFNIP